MDKNASSLTYGLLLVIIVVIAVALALVFTGYIPLTLIDTNQEDIDTPIGSENCGYSDGEIINMFENLMGKDLNNDAGFSVVNALNMKACGSNSKTPNDIIGDYMDEFSDDWYLLGDDVETESGYYYRFVFWGNTPSLSNASLIRSVISGNGVVVKEWYGYSTMTITSYGTRSGYMACVAWLNS